MDGNINVADAVFGLEYLFDSGPGPACSKALDANDDGVLNIVDPIAILRSLFAGAPLPGPDACGFDESDDSLTCEENPLCE